MITHLCSDEKFIDWVIKIFEKLNANNNLFLVLTDNKNLTYVKQKEKVEIYSYNHARVLELCNESEAVIIHSFLDKKYYWVGAIDKQVKVLWSCWGADFYNQKVFEQKYYSLYGKLTKEYIQQHTPKKRTKARIIDNLRSLHKYYYKLKTGTYPLEHHLHKAYKRIDYLATVIPSEFELIKNTLSLNKTVKYLPFSYGSLSGILGSFLENESKLGKGILVGNSAHPTNNHLEIIENLKEKNIKSQLLFPLSYGSEPYKKMIVEEGRVKFGKDFIPLTRFLSLEEYIKTVTSCSVMIMNQYRQQAVGNIILGLYLGMRVFLNPKSKVYSFLKEKGAIVFDFEAEFNKEEDLLAIDEVQKKKNREILHQIWGDKIIRNQTESLIEALKNDKK